MSATGEVGAATRDRANAGTRSGRWRWVALVLFGPPLAAVMGWCILLQPEPLSVLAPLLGPWAGHLYGHTDCTLATSAPGATVGVVALGCVLVALAAFPGGLALRWTARLLGLTWLLWWLGMALLSVANTRA